MNRLRLIRSFAIDTTILGAGLFIISCSVLVEYRLINGKRPTQGRLEITYNGVRGSVCGGDTFKEAEARVVCKSLGYRYVKKPGDN